MKKTEITAIALSVIATVLAICSLVINKPAPATEIKGDEQYVLYLGTNDKDTNTPIYDKAESKERLKAILIENFGGYTIQEADGGWIGDDGKEYQEYTLVIYLSDTNIDQVHSVCNKLIDEYNQSSILIQSNTTKTEFYSKSE